MENNKKKDFPGYPHYPASEDITRAGNNNGQLSVEGGDDITGARPDDSSSDADITPEEMDMLSGETDGPETRRVKNTALDSTDEDGYALNEVSGVFESNKQDDLDIPGSEDDDRDEQIGEEDEENNYYSLGGNDNNPEETIED